MKAVVLAGGQDVSRCPLSMVRPRPLFPLVTGVLLDDMLRTLHSAGVSEAIVCANGRTRILREHFLSRPGERVGLSFYDDELPRGTAGCIKDVADQVSDGPFLVIEGGLFIEGDVAALVDDHRASGAAMTVGAVPAWEWAGGDGAATDAGPLAPVGMYVVEPAVVEQIPSEAYCDIKEQLLPRLKEKRLKVCASRYRGRHRRITDARSYSSFLHEMLGGAFGQQRFDGLAEVAPRVWVAADASVDERATLIGPVVVGSGAVVGKEAVVAGPALIGEGAIVRDKAFVSHSILWPRSEVGFGAVVEHAILTDAFRVRDAGRVSRCVAVDRNLNLGDVHGLRLGGYEVAAQGVGNGPTLGSVSVTSALTKLWRSLMAMRHGDEMPLGASGERSHVETGRPRR